MVKGVDFDQSMCAVAFTHAWTSASENRADINPHMDKYWSLVDSSHRSGLTQPEPARTPVWLEPTKNVKTWLEPKAYPGDVYNTSAPTRECAMTLTHAWKSASENRSAINYHMYPPVI